MSRPNGATPTWSGYTHQGKVGLLVALVEIERIIGEGSVSDLEGWSLEFEGAEDFDIKDGSDIVYSRHQVKAYPEGTASSSYKTVLIAKKDGKPGFKIDGVRANECYLHTIVEITDWSDKKKYNPLSIKRYKYPDGNNYCLHSKVEKEYADNHASRMGIGIIKSLAGSVAANEPELIWTYLSHTLDDEIHKGHVGKERPELSFCKIYEIITINNPLKIIDYQRDKLIASYCLQTYHDLLIANSDPDSEAKIIRTTEYIDNLLSLPRNSFSKAIRIMHPNQSDEIFSITKRGLTRSVYTLIGRVGISTLNIETSSIYRNGSETPYIITALDDEEDMLSQYIRDITRNQLNSNSGANLLYRNSNIVNLEINHKCSNTCNHGIITETTTGDLSDHILEPVSMRFIKVDDAIAEINAP